MKNLIKKYAEQIRFVTVGLGATVIDWGILFVLVVFGGFPNIPSNFVSTSVAMVFSFFTNKSYTFKAKNITGKHVVYFIIITVIGMWVIQPVIIEGVNLLLGPWFTNSAPVVWLGDLLGSWFKANYLVLFLGKGLATAASLTWNYLMYRNFVFVKSKA
ncbi:MAG: GtrA family protein [Candidatus Saccharibacteria bacterium]|nr:GtrA family protein [Candidatus Saccharibacteria bacterium]